MGCWGPPQGLQSTRAWPPSVGSPVHPDGEGLTGQASSCALASPFKTRLGGVPWAQSCQARGLRFVSWGFANCGAQSFPWRPPRQMRVRQEAVRFCLS